MYVPFDLKINTIMMPFSVQAEVDVDKSQLYSFIRERLHLLPTRPSNKNQYIKISVKPDTSSQRNFTLAIGGRFFQSLELEQMEAQNWDQQKQTQRQQQKQQQSQKNSWISFLWGSQDEEEQQQQRQQEPISTIQWVDYIACLLSI